MSCKPVLVSGQEVEAHRIGGVTYAKARALAEECGGLVMWDTQAEQAIVVSPMAPNWASFSPLAERSRDWRPEFQMHQVRFDHIWLSALRRNVDPRLMVAVLLHENTGSFNTNPANAAQYNGNGPDADWIADTARAVSHVRGKLSLYRRAIDAGFKRAAQSLGLDGTAVQFVGWPGPIRRHDPNWGCYAQHADWWSGVSRFYEELGGSVRLLSQYWATAPYPDDVPALRCEAVTDRPDLCSDLRGKVGRPGVVTWVL